MGEMGAEKHDKMVACSSSSRSYSGSKYDGIMHCGLLSFVLRRDIAYEMVHHAVSIVIALAIIVWSCTL